MLVTRSKKQSGSLAQRLALEGASVIEVPVISIGPPTSWEMTDRAIKEIEEFQWIVFASSNAVRNFLARCEEAGRAPARSTQFAAIGPSTAAALEQCGYKVSFMPTAYIAEAFVEQFLQHFDVNAVSILWPRGDRGRTVLADALVCAGATVRTVQCYKTELTEDIEGAASRLAQLLVEGSVDAITFANGQSARNFAELAQHGLLSRALEPRASTTVSLPVSDICQLDTMIPYLEAIKIVAIGPETARSAVESLGKVDVVASEHTIDGLIKAMIMTFST